MFSMISPLLYGTRAVCKIIYILLTVHKSKMLYGTRAVCKIVYILLTDHNTNKLKCYNLCIVAIDSNLFPFDVGVV